MSILSLTELATQIRTARGTELSQVDAAKQLRVSERTFQAWEAGTAFPQTRHRARLAKWLEKRQAA